jgi:hypothetical protein
LDFRDGGWLLEYWSIGLLDAGTLEHWKNGIME